MIKYYLLKNKETIYSYNNTNSNSNLNNNNNNIINNNNNIFKEQLSIYNYNSSGPRPEPFRGESSNVKQFNFELFYNEFKKRFKKDNKPSKEFLEWFIGFFEGDGSFIIAKRGDLSIVITQSEKDLNILNYIKENLNIGSIYIQSKKNKTYRWIIQNRKDIYLISLLLNGNLILPIRSLKLNIFLAKLNYKLAINNENLIKYDQRLVLPSLNDAWISGFTDSEGCFTSSIFNINESSLNKIKIKSETFTFRVRYILTQKYQLNRYVLEYILNLFNLYNKNNEKSIGSIVPHSVKDVWELRINGLKNCLLILTYFDKYNLKTSKKESYDKFKIILYKIKNKEHLTIIGIKKLKELTKLINIHGKKDKV